MRIRRYSELIDLDTFEERFDYLRIGGQVGRETFGFDRYINQQFYTSHEWKRVRNTVIIRDNACDLGVFGYEIKIDLLIHHINPMTIDDIHRREEWILDPEYLITTSHRTHNAIHYGQPSPYPKVVLDRTPGDTRLW